MSAPAFPRFVKGRLVSLADMRIEKTKLRHALDPKKIAARVNARELFELSVCPLKTRRRELRGTQGDTRIMREGDPG
jgi:hypothetical protein